MKKHLLCLLLAAALLFCGCEVTVPTSGIGMNSGNQKEETPTTLETISYLYYPDSDICPLTTRNLANQKLFTAVYPALFTVDENLNITDTLAQSHTADSTKITFTVDTSRRFSDGSSLSASLAARCFEKVLETPESPYYRQLSNVADVSFTINTLTITLKHPDPNAIYAMDIPIVKTAGSENAPEYYGCGSYKIDRRNGVNILNANPYAAEPPAIPTIYLLEPKEDGSVTDMFNGGVLDILPTDLLTDHAFSASRNYITKSYLTNTMLFVGVNGKRQPLSEAKFRQALGKLMPRDEIVKSVLMDLGQSTQYPFYPKWSELPEYTESADEAILKVFEDAGCQNKNGQLYAEDGSILSLELLVCTDNKVSLAVAEKIKARAKAFGIMIELKERETERYFSALEDGNFDLYIATYDLGKALDPTALYKTDSEQNYGRYELTDLDTAFTDYQNGKISLDKYLTAFADQSPILPLAFTKNAVYLTEGIVTDTSFSQSSPLGDLSKWSAK